MYPAVLESRTSTQSLSGPEKGGEKLCLPLTMLSAILIASPSLGLNHHP